MYALSLLILLACVTGLWLLSLRLKNASIIDIFWGTGFVIANAVYFALTPQGFLLRKLLIGLLVTLWGLRLSLYILWRSRGKPEDFRYRKWRDEHGPRWWWRSFFQVFLLQGVLLWIISFPLGAATHSNFNETLQWLNLPTQPAGIPLPDRLGLLDLLGTGLWLIGFIFEAGGDYQMARFKANPANRGQVMDQGLWRYTRHPNYFGDALQWWGFYLIAAAAGGWWTLFSPLLMTILLLRVSGVSLLEKTLETRPGYRKYMATTPPFFPWFPK